MKDSVKLSMKTKTKIVLTASSLTAFYLYFNRNPYREIQSGIVSPSDGTIVNINTENNKIDISIELLDVHVQRAPISGIITDIQDFPDENKNIITITDNITLDIINVERRGGLIARTVKTYIKNGDYVEKGQVIGRILLGSHASIYPIYNPIVNIGDHVLAGQTISL